MLADIHANLPALEAVIAACVNRGAETFVVCGDSIGYYYWPSEVLAILREIGAVCIKGNHEQALLDALRGGRDTTGAAARSEKSVIQTMEALNDDDIQLIRRWPFARTLEIAGRQLLACHGSPGDPNRYVYPTSTDEELETIAVPGISVIAMGHTHYPMERKVKDLLFINPGSVGQPRNRTPGAAWAMWDSETDVCQFYVEKYDYRYVADLALKRDPDHPYLREVLVRT